MKVFHYVSRKRSLVADHLSYVYIPINKANPVHPRILDILIQTISESKIIKQNDFVLSDVYTPDLPCKKKFRCLMHCRPFKC